MNYHQLTSKDVSQLLELWNEVVLEYPLTMKKLVQTLFCDENYDNQATFLAENEKEIVGFCIAIKRKYPYLEKGLEEDKGWIYAIAVKKVYQRQGIGSRLLAYAENYLQCPHVIVGAYSPHYLMCGIDANKQETVSFFTKHGYQLKACAYPMKMDLTTYQMPKSIQELKQRKEAEGYSFVYFTWADGEAFLSFLQMNFSAGWRKHVISAMQSATAENTILLCKKGKEIIGYVQRGILQEANRYGPFGVKETYRDAGIGSILAHLMWQDMKANGLKNVWFHSTDENGRRFYERQGMQVVRKLVHCEKVRT